MRIKIAAKSNIYWLVMIAFFLLQINYVLYHTITEWIEFKDLLRVFSILVLFKAYLLKTKGCISFTKVEIAVFCFMVILLFITKGETFNFLIIFLIIKLINWMNKESYLRCVFQASLLSLIIYIVLFKLGVIINTVDMSGGRYRNTLGFDNVNAGGIYFFIFLATFFLLKPTFLRALIAFLLNAYIFFLTDCRTPFLCLMLLIIVCKIDIFKFLYGKIIAKSILVFSIIGSFFLPFLSSYIVAKIPILDFIVSYRLSYMVRDLKRLSCIEKVFGGSIMNFDNDVMYIIMKAGVIVCFIFLCIFLYAFVNFNNLTAPDFALLMCIILFGVFEEIWFAPEFILIFYFWKIILDNSIFAHKFRARKELKL